MAGQNFVDYVKVHLTSGNGGAGSMHFHRDNRTAKGGPDGGDGGRGGDIILVGNKQLWTLLHLKYQRHHKAGHGGNGSGDHSSGAAGSDIVLEVPLGTIVKDPDTGEQLYEITEHEQQVVVMKGGRGGLGNSHFKSSTNQTPRYSQPGEEGMEGWRIIELKVLADVGLVGFPNAGKSTLLSVITSAKPKIGNYAFTTLTPNLGIVKYRDMRSFIMADIPGIIENAHQGKGLGTRFLRHIERNSALLFMVPADADDITEQYEILLRELELYNPELMDKPKLLAITKSDMIDDEMKGLLVDDMNIDIDHVFISSVAQQGLQELKDKLWIMLDS